MPIQVGKMNLRYNLAMENLSTVLSSYNPLAQLCAIKWYKVQRSNVLEAHAWCSDDDALHFVCFFYFHDSFLKYQNPDDSNSKSDL